MELHEFRETTDVRHQQECVGHARHRRDVKELP